MSGPSVVVPGNHDGVHRGHRALLARAREVGARVVAYTFDPHPSAVLNPAAAPIPLTTVARRTELLRAAGADEVVVQPFDRDFAALGPEEFVDRILRAKLDARAAVVGPDYRFGRERAGGIDTLRAAGIEVHLVDPVLVGGERVSSSGIRTALSAGDVAKATTWLGRVHDVEGVVVRGDQRGRTLGFPTANLRVDPVLAPADGIYAVVVRRLDRTGDLLFGAASLGVRPQFDAGRSFEVFLLDFEGDLYGERLRVGFVARIRGEERFSSVDALVARMHRDVGECRAQLGAADREHWRWI